ncbi:hypothetical protein [Vacuolonema iberomarrocanum]|uniref:hypothetical protein n=1 Tax=Vacuolonema iberomarrocanum TaxID=3454632 RepID=UPI001A092F40|nr:tetratricopeptide repeat protein [filamentous cyanobacterium LEGE 07170]
MPNDTPPTPEAIAEATTFLREILQHIANGESNREQIYHFFKTNLHRLDKTLLHSIPNVFSELIANETQEQQHRIALNFVTFADRISEFPLGSRALNLEMSITCYELTLAILTREKFPEDWARVQNNLAIAYSDRIRGDWARNIEAAIAAYRQSLQVRTREAMPVDWAMTQGNLARALMAQATLAGDPTKLDTAIALLQEELKVAVPGSPFFINDQYSLGNALSRRYEQSQNPDNLQHAINAYTTALNAIDPEHYDRPSIWQAIPETQSILGSRLVKEGRWQEGLQLLLQSVRQLSSGDNLLAHANALYQTGRAQETMADWDNACLYYRDALRLYNHLGDTLGIAQSRAGLGGVLVSRGFLEKGMAELATAKKLYQQLDKPQQVQDLEQLYAAAQRILAQQSGDSSEARV